MALKVALLLVAAAAGAGGQSGAISVVAGGAPVPTPIKATNASLGNVNGVAVDAAGDVYFSTSLWCVYSVDRAGMLTRVAGIARPGFTGDGGPATQSRLGYPGPLAFGPDGSLFLADSFVVRSISPGGTIRTALYNPFDSIVVGRPNGTPYGMATDAAGNLYVAYADAHEVRRISPSGESTTLLGPELSDFNGVALDGAGNLYVTEPRQSRAAIQIS